jgi:hypothetical protein
MPEELYSTENVTPPSNLFAGEFDALTEGGQIASGEGALSAGQILGQVTLAVGDVTADAGNTGANVVSTVTAGVATQEGVYTLTCIDATVAGSEVFEVQAPDGAVLPPATVAVAYVSPQLNFTITDPGTNAVVGDSHTVAVDHVAGGDWKAHDAAAVDGSQHPKGVLAVDVDATSAAVVTTVYRTGHFRAAALTGYTAALHEQLAAHNIFVR